MILEGDVIIIFILLMKKPRYRMLKNLAKTTQLVNVRARITDPDIRGSRAVLLTTAVPF